MRANRSAQSAGVGTREVPAAVMGTPAGQRGGSLPVDVTSFVGRRRELGEVKQLLSDFRLVTLTGVGGVGKTRLARRVAAEVRRAFPDGVWFIDLTAVRDPDPLAQVVEDPELLAHLVAAELGLPEQAARSPLQLLSGHLATRNQLLMLDNCEHLISACGVVASALLRTCPRLRILATSREPLGISGETTFPVPPLATPDPDRQPAVAQLLLYESVTVRSASRGGRPGFPSDRGEPSRGVRYLSSPRRCTARDRARGGLAQGAEPAADPGAARRPVCPADQGKPHRAGPPANLAGMR